MHGAYQHGVHSNRFRTLDVGRRVVEEQSFCRRYLHGVANCRKRRGFGLACAERARRKVRSGSRRIGRRLLRTIRGSNFGTNTRSTGSPLHATQQLSDHF